MKPSSTKPHSFPKSQRLCSKKEIDGLFSGGRQIFVHPVRCIYMLHGEISGDGGDLPNTDGPEATEVVPAPTQVLVSVPKRLHKRAVARGLIKRRIREAYRLNKTSGSMQTIATMALVYVSPEISSFKSIENAVGTILSKILGNN